MISEERQTKPKGGRPKMPVKKETVTGVRFTKSEYFIVKHKAEKSGLKISAYIRQMSINGKLMQRLNEEERQFVRHLVGISNNLNQLTKKAHQAGIHSIQINLEAYTNIINELLLQLKK
ncbi:MAG: MobC family plasmid mobilization relaxosome protein [Bacteroidota bacterium]|nr:MobC family plasmid mobilization relaxosome protein [Bacteroidota bacterium]